MRHDRREPDQLRPIRIERGFTQAAPGSVLIQAGRTTVLCTASIAAEVPPWMASQGRGWITAEYDMLPGSTSPRKRRQRLGNLDGRSSEIQRLVGRSLRAIADLGALGERTVTVDCDVLEADGGTRALSVTGAWIALVDALRRDLLPGTALPLRDSVAAISVGWVDGQPLLDLDYSEDSAATVDMNAVVSGSGELVEIQATGEKAAFGQSQLLAMLDLARGAASTLTALQRQALGEHWPLP